MWEEDSMMPELDALRRKEEGDAPLLALSEDKGVVRPEVAAFARLMEIKLRDNDSKKPHWKDDDPLDLLDDLVAEVEELNEALTRGADCLDVALECADIANFAMMIADVAGECRYLRPVAGVTALRIEEVRR